MTKHLEDLRDLIQAETHTRLLIQAQRNEVLVKKLLSRWVSEIPPAIAIDENNNIIGLTPEDTPIGVKGFILRLIEE